jgi:hypothetical protein
MVIAKCEVCPSTYNKVRSKKTCSDPCRELLNSVTTDVRAFSTDKKFALESPWQKIATKDVSLYNKIKRIRDTKGRKRGRKHIVLRFVGGKLKLATYNKTHLEKKEKAKQRQNVVRKVINEMHFSPSDALSTDLVSELPEVDDDTLAWLSDGCPANLVEEPVPENDILQWLDDGAPDVLGFTNNNEQIKNHF